MSYSDAVATRTEQEVQIEIAADLALRGVSDKGFPETSTQRQLISNAAARGARGDALRSQMVKAGSTATVLEIPEADGREGWTEFLGTGVFGLTRDPATKAQHRFRLTNDPAGIQRSIAARSLTARFGTIDFINVEVLDAAYAGSGTLAPGGTFDLLFEATTAGSSGNIPPDVVSQLVTAIAGVSVGNPAIGDTGSSIVKPARDIERLESYVARMRARWGATGIGAGRGSIAEWIGEAFVAAGVDKTVTKWFIDDVNPDGPASMRIYISNDANLVTTDEIAIVSDYILPRLSHSANPPAGVTVLAAPILVYTFAVTIKSPARAADSTYPSALAAVVAKLNADTPLGRYTLYKAEVIERFQAVQGTVNTTTTLEDIELGVGQGLRLVATFEVTT